MLFVGTIDEDVYAANEITLVSRVFVDEEIEYILVVVVEARNKNNNEETNTC